ncbi:hypothetical protein RF11_09296 [Thelohanellus kitauei]|uniref:Uncharacterized protein n=1 Tax=Thelohanellus kitauei TaxID=669202 RepID=A0A0C2MCN2_THEKT|nr:hypothetical protein RF11_09296 [Thelohanellus kitauei]
MSKLSGRLLDARFIANTSPSIFTDSGVERSAASNSRAWVKRSAIFLSAENEINDRFTYADWSPSMKRFLAIFSLGTDSNSGYANNDSPTTASQKLVMLSLFSCTLSFNSF